METDTRKISFSLQFKKKKIPIKTHAAEALLLDEQLSPAMVTKEMQRNSITSAMHCRTAVKSTGCTCTVNNGFLPKRFWWKI